MKAEWDLYSNFSKAEFDCKHSGRNEMKHSFMAKICREYYEKQTWIADMDSLGIEHEETV